MKKDDNEFSIQDDDDDYEDNNTPQDDFGYLEEMSETSDDIKTPKNGAHLIPKQNLPQSIKNPENLIKKFAETGPLINAIREADEDGNYAVPIQREGLIKKLKDFIGLGEVKPHEMPHTPLPTVYRKSGIEDTSGKVIELDDGKFDVDMTYFNDIENPIERRQIEKIADTNHGYYSDIPKGKFKDLVAYLWIRIRKNISEIAQNFNMNKLGENTTLDRNEILKNIIMIWSQNGSIALLCPTGDEDMIQVAYERISIRHEVNTKENEQYESSIKDFSTLKIINGEQVDIGKYSISSPLAIYWCPKPNSNNTTHYKKIRTEIENIGPQTRTRKSSALDKIKENS
ncbi:MAG: hypothetical protein UR27_C0006G0041 [Candidatus Peregrinibacteria bacterium GW2011_GWA2_33_10]|nr:MAG: hypothetical protein UR27_C0006G0041 [Candidatus Peregrinibacteria bacterium GW2011_GWA2_33_10]KKP39589.1 MAG: hypothetical protein UR30_C0009G0010 [Candidatus Peregrinibacteria bacterium GW2011_GWC2_33_13]OGJ50209.1 MAG: hypothetical protein A2229_04905 [Candidatus Peregrinibacteria bacterium RIFOXYA2_FULL_33_7]